MWKQGQDNHPVRSLQRNPKLSAQFDEGDILNDAQFLQFGSFVQMSTREGNRAPELQDLRSSVSRCHEGKELCKH